MVKRYKEITCRNCGKTFKVKYRNKQRKLCKECGKEKLYDKYYYNKKHNLPTVKTEPMKDFIERLKNG